MFILFDPLDIVAKLFVIKWSLIDFFNGFYLFQVNAMYQSGIIFSIIDGRMRSYPSKCVVRFLTLALKCCEEETDARPSTAEVVRELESIWHMMPDSDIRSVDPMVTDAEKVVTTPSSSSIVKIPYASFDVSGGELVSGVVPTITPR